MSDENTTTLPWLQPGWRETATSWIDAQLLAQRVSLAGPIEQPHVRPWSTVLHVPTGAGLLYFKAVAPCSVTSQPSPPPWRVGGQIACPRC